MTTLENIFFSVVMIGLIILFAIMFIACFVVLIGLVIAFLKDQFSRRL